MLARLATIAVLVIASACGVDGVPDAGADGAAAPADSAWIAVDAQVCGAERTAVTWTSSDPVEAADLAGTVTTAFWTGDQGAPTLVWVAAPPDVPPITCDALATAGWLDAIAGTIDWHGRTIARAGAVVLHDPASLAATAHGHFVADRTCLSMSSFGTWVALADNRGGEALAGCFDAVFGYCIAPTGDVRGTFVAMHCPTIAAPESS